MNAGFFLFHIFGYEWTHNRHVIKSMIANLLGRTERIIYARDTYVSEEHSLEAVEFLRRNHRQGATYAKLRLGLRLKTTDELVAVMTFNKMRSTMGRTADDEDENRMELSRFCTLCNTSVVGGASKLFKYFLAHSDCTQVISFSDRAHTLGKLYNTLGFTCPITTSPGYVWVNTLTDEAKNRVQCQKRNLSVLFRDPDINISEQTEQEIMMSHGYAQVFDAGLIRWTYNR